MQPFDESLISFLVDYRENALEELKSVEQYDNWKQKQADLLSKLESQLTKETLALFEDYRETSMAILSLEFNKILLCGVAMQANIFRRFDATAPEYQACVSKFLN